MKNINCKCETHKESYTICLSCQEIEVQEQETKINSIGFTPKGRQILNDQEHIFVEALSEMEVLSDEQKFEKLKQKYFSGKEVIK